MPNQPGPFVVCEPLEALAGAFSRRRRAIKHQVRSFRQELGVDEDDEGLQFLAVDVQLLLEQPTYVSFRAWSDGWTFVQARRLAGKHKGWKLKVTVEGGMPLSDPKAVVTAFEKTIGIAQLGGDEPEEKVLQAWKAVGLT